ncbi:MAG: murein biosynthesis integral membrane protein MurJ [Pirellulales bacterium]
MNGRHPLITGARVTSLGTLSSRVLGMVRDMAMAAIFGLVGGGVMDAFVIAYRIPNLFRRLFGEGALTASYLPVLAGELQRDRDAAWRLVSVVLTWAAVLLAGVVVLGELVFAGMWLLWGHLTGMPLLLELSAALLPYLLLICLAAQLSATLHALGHFAVPALTPVVLNLCWLAAALLVAPWFAPDKEAQALVIVGAILIAGVLQVGVQAPVLHHFGFRFHYDPPATREARRRIGRAIVPMLFGLAVTQTNAFLDSVLAWGLARAPGGPERIAWLGGTVPYPLHRGAAAALYYGERLYHFPLGVLGLAVAAAIFPLLSRHAARGQRRQLGTDLTLGLRLVVCLGVPAGIGLIVLARPIVTLLFERGQFTPDDTIRAARVVTCYGLGVWAFCAMPVAVRGFYAIGDTATPVRIGAWVVVLNLGLNLGLIWPLAENGLALATSLAANVQVLALILVFSRREIGLRWRGLGATLWRTLAASAAMAAACWGTLQIMPRDDTLSGELLRVAAPLTASVVVYAVAFRLLGGRELGHLIRGGPTEG